MENDLPALEKPVIKLLLAEPTELIRIGVRALIKSENLLQLVGEADTFNDTLQLSRKLTPDLIILDLKLKEGFITERIPELQAVSPTCKILVFTLCTEREQHLLALRLGAVGIFSKEQPARLFLKAIHRVHSGEVWLDNSLTSGLLQSFKQDAYKTKAVQSPLANQLTSRELAVARLAVQGLPAKKIASQLFISEKTVRNQLVVIYDKLGVTGQVELVLHASRLGLITPV